MNLKKQTIVPDELLVNKIYFIRGQKVMLDRDPAELYRVETKVLKQTVKRNPFRFPEDFMFEMSVEEFENWRSQFVTSNSDKMGLRYPPFCFTEQGVTMLSSVLNSKRAIEMNIRVVRLFIRLREMMGTNKEVLHKLEQLERRVGKNGEEINVIFSVIRKLLSKPKKPMKKIGYKTNGNA
ncbi:MAG: ORF6N domain-containing protein [Bacteroidetes bacterium]|nr:ORF6N domain-containing protein [Bacteroidota bacterium]